MSQLDNRRGNVRYGISGKMSDTRTKRAAALHRRSRRRRHHRVPKLFCPMSTRTTRSTSPVPTKWTTGWQSDLTVNGVMCRSPWVSGAMWGNLETLGYVFVADGSIFIQIFVVGSERRTCFETECVIALHGHPRSMILAPIESTHATSYWSSIVTLMWLIYIWPRFRDIAGFLRTATPPLFHRNFRGVPLGLDCRCCGSEERKP